MYKFLLMIASYLLLMGYGTLSWAAAEGELVQWLGTKGGVNWSRGQITATGIGVPPERAHYQVQRQALACRAAVVDAQRNLLETTQGVRVESATLVKDAMVESDLIRISVKGMVKGAQLVERKIELDDSCRVTMSMPLTGSLASQLYGYAMKDKQTWWKQPDWLKAWPVLSLIPMAEAAPVSVPNRRAEDIELLSQRLEKVELLLKMNPQRIAEGRASGAPTGLIIDARGSNFIPSMSPRLHQMQGSVIYPQRRHQQEAQHTGQLIALFMKDLLLAQGHPRVGERPLVVKALRTYGLIRTELVLAKAVSAQLSSLIEAGFLQHAGVIVVMD